MPTMRTILGIGVLLIAAAGVARAQEPDGTSLYRENCRTCHGTAGKPTQRALDQYPKIPTFDAAFFAARSPDSILTILTHGKGKDMKSFASKLTPAERRAVAAYIRATFGAKP